MGAAAAAASPVAAAAVEGQVEEVTPDQAGVEEVTLDQAGVEEVTLDQAGVGVVSPGHLALRGLLPISIEEVAAEFLPEPPARAVRARDLPANDWPTAHLNYLRRAGPTGLEPIARLAVA